MLKLRDFQEGVVAHLLPRKRGGISVDMGLGKSCIALTIGARARLNKWLIICPDNAFSVWRDEIPRWIPLEWPEADIKLEFIDDAPWNRDLQWNTDYDISHPNRVHIRIVTMGTFVRDWREVTKTGLKGKRSQTVRASVKRNYDIPQILIYDEAKGIRNRNTQAFKILQVFVRYYNVEYFYPMTGTPGHEPKHFWTMLHLIDPRYFKSYWQFVLAFHQVDETPFGQEVNEPKNLPQWHALLARYFSVIKEDDPGIADQRPPITRQLLEVSMDADQQKLYREFMDEMMSYVQADDKLVFAQNEFALCTRLRQLLVCPKILSPSLSVGTAIKDFADTVEPEAHNVIFTPFTSAQVHFKEFLTTRGFKRVYILRGGISTPERDAILSMYRQEAGTVICSTLYAQAFSLEPATRSFAIGYDWDPDNNRQAEKRLHRLTTENPITSYYYTYRSTFDERLCAIVNLKQQRVNVTIPSQLREVFSP